MNDAGANTATRVVWAMYLADALPLMARDIEAGMAAPHASRAALAEALSDLLAYDVIGDPAASDEPLTVTLARDALAHAVQWETIAAHAAAQYPALIAAAA